MVDITSFSPFRGGVNFGLNVATHVLILFTFLVCFFFLYISNVLKSLVNDQINGKINEQIPLILQTIDQDDTNHIIDWDAVKYFADDMENKSQGSDPNVDKNNNNLLKVSAILLISFFVLLVGAYIYTVFIAKYDVSVRSILSENVVIFIFVGMLELFFFVEIVSKYIPVPPNIITDTVLERIKDHIGQIIGN